MHCKVGKVQKKVLMFLAGGLSLAFAGGSLGKQVKILRAMEREWAAIDREALRQAIRALYRSQLVDFREEGGGVVKITLSKEGKERVRTFDADTLSIPKPRQWDGRWRIVCFDIPKDKKKVREAFRSHLKRIGFHQFQKSVFIHPYPCGDEVDFLIELYEVRPYVRQIIATDIDNELHLKHTFHLR